jgi:hypothetical protein
MKIGDRFIFYGTTEVVKGQVIDRHEKVTYDLKNGVKVIVSYIISDNGKKYRENMCLKIESDIGPNILRKLINLISL